MSGNISEWCWDRMQYDEEVWEVIGESRYSSGSEIDPRGASSGSARVNRGGSWSEIADDIRTSYRNYSDPFYCSGDLGFRLVRTK